jgi:putative ABC transport system permease protein
MLELKHIKKTYKIGDIETRALDDINVAFREKEFVAILGPSGSGKTTCLNIIGGLDRYDSGEMTIKGKKPKTLRKRIGMPIETILSALFSKAIISSPI